MKQVFFALLLMLVGQNSFAQTITGGISSEQQSQNWSSFILDLSGNKEARMTTSSTASTGDRVTLAIQMQPPCNELKMTLIFGLSKPRQVAGTLTWLLTMRVDNQQPLFGSVKSISSIGDKFAIFTLDTLPQFPDLLHGMIIGQGIQMRADEQNGSVIGTIGFSLYGFTASFNRIKTLCQQLAATRPAPNTGGVENLRQLPRSSDLPPNPNVPQVPTLPKHPNSGV